MGVGTPVADTKSQPTKETSIQVLSSAYFVAHRPTPTSKKAERAFFLDLSEAAQCLLSLNTRCTPITIMIKGCDQRIKMPIMIRQRIAIDENSDVDRRQKSRPRNSRSVGVDGGARSTGGVRQLQLQDRRRSATYFGGATAGRASATTTIGSRENKERCRFVGSRKVRPKWTYY